MAREHVKWPRGGIKAAATQAKEYRSQEKSTEEHDNENDDGGRGGEEGRGEENKQEQLAKLGVYQVPRGP